MPPSDMNLKIKTGTVGYNNKILISDGNFSLGKNEKVNAGLAKSEEETTTKQMTTIHKEYSINKEDKRDFKTS